MHVSIIAGQNHLLILGLDTITCARRIIKYSALLDNLYIDTTRTVICLTTRICSRTGAKWTIPRYKRDWQNICALMPSYLEDGTNGTVVTYLDSSTEAVYYRLPWVLDDLLGYLRTSRAVLTKQSRTYLGKQARRVPLLASPQFCLVPVKGRTVYNKYEQVTGYVVLRHVENVIPDGPTNRVYFTGGHYITVLDMTETLWHNLNTAKEMKEKLLWESTQLQSVGA